MRESQWQSRGRGAGALLAVVVVATLTGCRQDGGTVQVSTGAFPPRVPVEAPPPVPAGPTSKFQGAVAAVDPTAGEMVVGVRIVWTPVLKAERQDRRVVVGPQTRWKPGPAGFGDLRPGDEVQVEAEDLGNDTWRAVEVELFDVD